MRLIILKFVLLISTTCISQNTIEIKGTIYHLKDPLSFANFQLLDISKKQVLAYSISDKNGNYRLEYQSRNSNDTLVIKVSFLGYQPVEDKIILSKKENSIHRNFYLKESSQNLDEIIIRPDNSLLEISRDTIKYNLKRSLTGKERVLGDVLENLPGVGINDSGKLTVNGQNIKNLLVDGESFFDSQHNLALENISADMIKGVTFFKKFKDFTNFNDNQGTTINIELTEKAKKNIKGNVEGLSAIEDSYLLKSGIFNFKEKLKLTLITDLNNIGDQSMTSEDYFALNDNLFSVIISNGSTEITQSRDEDLPYFLQNTNRVKNRRIQLGALNYSYKPSPNFRLRGFVIMNNINQNQFQNIERDFFTNSVADQNESKRNNLKNLFGILKLQSDYRFDKRSLLSYSANYSLSDAAFLLDVERPNTALQQDVNISNNYWGHQVNYKRSLSDKSSFDAKFFQEETKEDSNLGLISDDSILTYGSNVQQNSKLLNSTKGARVKLTHQISKYDFLLSSSYIATDETFENTINPLADDNITSDLERNIRNLNLSLNVGIELNSKLNINSGLSFDTFLVNNNKKNRLRPEVGLSFNPNAKHSFNINYGLNNEFSVLKENIDSDLIIDYLNLVQGSSQDSSTLFYKNSINFVYTNMNLPKGNSFFFYTGLTQMNEDIALNIQQNPEPFTLNRYSINNLNESYIATAVWEYRIPKSTFILNAQSALFLVRNQNEVAGTPNIFELFDSNNKLSISKRDKEFLNYSFGLKWGFQRFSNSFNQTNLQSNRSELFLKTDFGTSDQLFSGSIETSYTKFTSENNLQRTIFSINPTLYMTPHNSDFNFFIRGRNILNIDNPEIAESFSNSNFSENRISSALQGYIGIGLQWKF